jgi:hypothetical protein
MRTLQVQRRNLELTDGVVHSVLLPIDQVESYQKTLNLLSIILKSFMARRKYKDVAVRVRKATKRVAANVNLANAL